jgi:hypothetical protein
MPWILALLAAGAFALAWRAHAMPLAVAALLAALLLMLAGAIGLLARRQRKQRS